MPQSWENLRLLSCYIRLPNSMYFFSFHLYCAHFHSSVEGHLGVSISSLYKREAVRMAEQECLEWDADSFVHMSRDSTDGSCGRFIFSFLTNSRSGWTCLQTTFPRGPVLFLSHRRISLIKQSPIILKQTKDWGKIVHILFISVLSCNQILNMSIGHNL